MERLAPRVVCGAFCFSCRARNSRPIALMAAIAKVGALVHGRLSVPQNFRPHWGLFFLRMYRPPPYRLRLRGSLVSLYQGLRAQRSLPSVPALHCSNE